MRIRLREAFGRTDALLVHNPGLVFERYFDKERDGNQHEIQRDLFRRLKSAATPTPVYKAAYGEWRKAAIDAGATVYEVESLARVVVGMGAPGPSETGLLLNRTYGTPILPGSTLKGALRDAAAELLGLDRANDLDPSKAPVEILTAHRNADPLLAAFGSVEAMAAITILDAWWNPGDGQSPFVPDTITNHHPSYYTGNAPLALETENPNPVSYLALRRGIKFTIALIFPDPTWEAAFRPVLERALKNGIGAKVGQGYGRFKVTQWPAERGGAAPQAAEPQVPLSRAAESQVATYSLPPLPEPFPQNQGTIEVKGVISKIERKEVTVLFSNNQNVLLKLRQAPRKDLLGVGEEVSLRVQVQNGKIGKKNDELFKGDKKFY